MQLWLELSEERPSRGRSGSAAHAGQTRYGRAAAPTLCRQPAALLASRRPGLGRLDSAQPPAPSPLVLLVDETSLQAHLKVMVVSLAYRGRALPLAWWCYRNEAWPMGQVPLTTTLLRQIAPHVPPACPVLVQADRGIGCSPGLLTAIEALGWYFLVRVQRTLHPRSTARRSSSARWSPSQACAGRALSWRLRKVAGAPVGP